MLRYEARRADIGVRVILDFRQLPDARKWLEGVYRIVTTLVVLPPEIGDT